ncbi:phage head closure protein [Levilactobacillus brevis]
MVLNKFSPERFNQKLVFGVLKSVQNENTGANETSFEPSFSLWTMPYTRTLSQNLSINGTAYEDSIQMVVRHNSAINRQLIVQYSNQLYKIIDNSVDDSNQVIGYDILTLKLNQKAGK